MKFTNIMAANSSKGFAVGHQQQ